MHICLALPEEQLRSESPGSPVLPKLLKGKPETQLVLFCTWAALQGTQFSWDSTGWTSRDLCCTKQLHNSHWSKHHSTATCRGGALIHSFTSSDFLCGPVAQIFRQDFAHIAIFWKQLNHLQASGSRWEESKEQTSYISSIKSSSADFRTQASLCFTQGAWQRSPKLGVLAPTFSTGIKKWPSTLSHTPENSRITDSKLQSKMLNILVSYWNPAEINSKSLFRKL